MVNMKCIRWCTRMTVEKECTSEDAGKKVRYAIWKCSKCGSVDLKKLGWRQIKYRDNEDYRNYTKSKMRENYYRKKQEKLQSP